MSRLRPTLPWFRLAPLSGAVVADCSIDSSKLADSSVSADGIQDSAVTSIKIADSGVTTGDIADSAITSIKIADSGVATGDIADSAITSIKIADSGVATGDIADCAVTTAKLNDSAVTYAKVQTIPAARLLGRYDAAAGIMQEIKLGTNLTFDSDDSELNAAGAALADCSVDSSKLGDSAVSTDGLQDCSVTSIKIADSGVTTADIADSAVTGAKIADSSITAADIADSSIDSGKLGDCVVSTQGIQDSAVTTAKLNDAGITYAKIQNITAQRLVGREDALAGSMQEIGLTAPLQFDTNSDALELADSGITNGLIADCAIDSSKIADSAVTYQNIQTVTARRLLGREDAVAGIVQEIALSAPLEFDTDADAVEIADCGITTVLLKDSSVDSTKLLDCAVSTAGLQDSAVDSSKLADCSVSSAGIQDGTIVAADFYDTTIVTRIIELHVTDTTLATGDTLATFFVPAEFDSFDLVRVAAANKVYSTNGTPTFQIRDVTGSADMLSTKLTIDSGEKTSYTAATAAVIDTTNDTLLAGQEIAIDVDSAGTGTEDIYIILSVRKP